MTVHRRANVVVPDVLIPAEVIQARIDELAAMISHDYRDRALVAVGILKGAFMFTADLVRRISVPMELRFMTVESYGDDTRSSGEVRIVQDIDASIAGKHVMIIEDIVDTGRTLAFLRAHLNSCGPASLAVCALLDKVECHEGLAGADYTGFAVPNRFVVGYGLDKAGVFRNLDYIGVLSE